MLVLSRKPGQRIVIGDDVSIVVHRISGNRVSLAIEAPDDIRVMRGELQELREQFEAIDDVDSPQLSTPILETPGGNDFEPAAVASDYAR